MHNQPSPYILEAAKCCWTLGDFDKIRLSTMTSKWLKASFPTVDLKEIILLIPLVIRFLT